MIREYTAENNEQTSVMRRELQQKSNLNKINNKWNGCKSSENEWWYSRSSRPEVLLGKGALKICSKFTEEHPCRSAISIRLQSNFSKITFRHGCSPVYLLHIFKIPFPKNTSGWVLLVLFDHIGREWKWHSWHQTTIVKEGSRKKILLVSSSNHYQHQKTDHQNSSKPNYNSINVYCERRDHQSIDCIEGSWPSKKEGDFTKERIQLQSYTIWAQSRWL